MPPGVEPGPDQIVSSNGIGLAAFVRECGGEPLHLGIAPDRSDAIGDLVDRAAGADILVVTGGASVGEHDLVQAALTAKGMTLDFWKIAMRPGKPLMVGDSARCASSASRQPRVDAGLRTSFPEAADLRHAWTAARADSSQRRGLARRWPENDNRQDYVRARLSDC